MIDLSEYNKNFNYLRWLIYQLLSMIINHKTYNIPDEVGSLKIRPMSWEDFKGVPPENTWFLAHIYWGINYQCFNQDNKSFVKTNVKVLPKSWVNSEDFKLMKHEYGHYLIGCLCALDFEKKVNFELVRDSSMNFNLWCKKVLQGCLQQYCARQKLYDEQTYHYLNEQQQKQWEEKIRKQFIALQKYFKEKKLPEKKVEQLKVTKKPIQNVIIKKQTIRGNSAKKSLLSNNMMDKKISINKQINLYKNIQSINSIPKKNDFKIRSYSKQT